MGDYPIIPWCLWDSKMAKIIQISSRIFRVTPAHVHGLFSSNLISIIIFWMHFYTVPSIDFMYSQQYEWISCFVMQMRLKNAKNHPKIIAIIQKSLHQNKTTCIFHAILSAIFYFFMFFMYVRKINQKGKVFLCGFFRPGEKIEFPFWLGDGSGILSLFCTIMGPSMGQMPTSSQLTQPTLCKILSLSES